MVATQNGITALTAMQATQTKNALAGEQRMKVGDLVKPKHPFNEAMIGIVLDVEENFYTTWCLDQEDRRSRLTVYWAQGETTTEPDNYVEKVVGETKRNENNIA